MIRSRAMFYKKRYPKKKSTLCTYMLKYKLKKVWLINTNRYAIYGTNKYKAKLKYVFYKLDFNNYSINRQKTNLIS